MSTIRISTVQDFLDFSAGVYGQGASDNYLTVELAADIDMAGREWGGLTGGWYMYFQGNGHKIDNIYCVTADTWAFVGSLHGYIENLSLTNIYVYSGNSVAGVAEYLYSTHIKNVNISGYLEGRRGACGFVRLAQQSSNIENCYFAGALISYAGSTSVWFGGANVSGLTLGVYNCQFTGSLVSFASTCAIFGGGAATVVNCEFRGLVNAAGNIITGAVSGYIVNGLAIIEQGSSWGGVSTSGGIYNSYYDETAAGEALSIGLESAATAQIKSAEWMARAGMPCNGENVNFNAYFEGESVRTSSGSMSFRGLNSIYLKHLQWYVKSTLDYDSTKTSSIALTITNTTTGEVLWSDADNPRGVPIGLDRPFQNYDYEFPDQGILFPAENVIKIAWTLKNCQVYYDSQIKTFGSWWTGTGYKPASQPCIKSTLTLAIPASKVIDVNNDGYPHYEDYTGNDFEGYSADRQGYPKNFYIWKTDSQNDGYPWIVGYAVAARSGVLAKNNIKYMDAGVLKKGAAGWEAGSKEDILALIGIESE